MAEWSLELGGETIVMACSKLSLNKERFVSLLGKLIGESEHLQDNPPKFVPEEDR